MQKVYEGKSDNDLWKEGNKIVDQALSDKRHVYAALPGPLMLGFKMRFSPKDYDVTTILRWHDPVTMSDEGKKALHGTGPRGAIHGRAGDAAELGTGGDHKEAAVGNAATG